MPSLWKKFETYGSGFNLEMERDYKEKKRPYYRLKMYGLFYPENYEIAGYDLQDLIKKAIKEGDKFKK